MIRLGPCESRLRKEIREKKTLIAGLIDPEDFTPASAVTVAKKAESLGVSVIFVGGSTIADQKQLDDVVIQIKKKVTSPVILFPGNITGISRHADAILFSSLLNSTNTYFIIGAQSIGAMQVKRYGLETIPMGYLVFGSNSTTGFVGQVREIPRDKPAIATMYALAAQYLGMRTLYLEAGSGSDQVIPTETIKAVRKYFDGILIVGGGITNPESAVRVAEAGADIIVIGNLLQKSGYKQSLVAIVKAVNNNPSLGC